MGAHLLFQLTKDSTPVRAIYRSEKKRNQVKELFRYYAPKEFDKQFSQIEWLQGDILNVPFLEKTMQGCSFVYHCAALVSFHPRDFNLLNKINREGTANMVNVALGCGVEKFCHVSSTAAFSGNEGSMISEKSKWKITPTTTGYSISKYSAEKEVWRAIEEGLNAVIVNPCVIIGAGNWNDSSLTLFRTLQNGVKYFPPGSNAIVDARDVSEIMITLMKSTIHSHRFLCIGSNQSFRELMEKIATHLNVRKPTKAVNRSTVNIVRRILALKSLFSSKRSSMTKETVNSLFSNYAYDNSKVRKELNFEFRSLDDAIENAIKGRLD